MVHLYMEYYTAVKNNKLELHRSTLKKKTLLKIVRKKHIRKVHPV